ncbi:MAG: alpha/beta hydrolase family protein [Tangfeifania sp.]
MTMKFSTLAKTIFFSIVIISFSACHNLFNDDDPDPVNEYLISYETEKSYLPVLIETVFDQLVDQYPEMAAVRDRVEYGLTVYKITYYTTLQGEPQVASGLVCVPLAEGPFPVMSYQNGTNTLHSNAPSENPENQLYLMLESVASTGFVVAIPDYIGFGSSDNTFHPYLHKESTVHTVIDMLRAIKELTQNHLDVSVTSDLYISGYSQGGWATMAVQKAIEQDYSGEFNLKASACGAGPYDLSYINQYILNQENYPMPYFAGYMIDSYKNLGVVTTPIDSVFQEPYAEKIPALYDGTKSGEEINEELTTVIADLFTENYIENHATDTTFTSLIQTLTDNSVEAWATNIPTRIYHGTADDFVPAQVSVDIHQDFLDAGAGSNNVTLVQLPDLDHREGIVPTGLASIQWFLELTE